MQPCQRKRLLSGTVRWQLRSFSSQSTVTIFHNCWELAMVPCHIVQFWLVLSQMKRQRDLSLSQSYMQSRKQHQDFQSQGSWAITNGYKWGQKLSVVRATSGACGTSWHTEKLYFLVPSFCCPFLEPGDSSIRVDEQRGACERGNWAVWPKGVFLKCDLLKKTCRPEKYLTSPTALNT